MPCPIGTRISQGTAQFALKQLGEVDYILIHRKGWQGARIPLQLLHQLQTTEGHATVMFCRIDAEPGIGASLMILEKIRERVVKDANFLGFVGRYEDYGMEVAESGLNEGCGDTENG